MTKGHNKGSNNAHQSKEEVKDVPGQDSHMTNQKREKDREGRSGRNAEPDQSGGTKGQNAVG
jgi:hypothetical protein